MYNGTNTIEVLCLFLVKFKMGEFMLYMVKKYLGPTKHFLVGSLLQAVTQGPRLLPFCGSVTFIIWPSRSL